MVLQSLERIRRSADRMILLIFNTRCLLEQEHEAAYLRYYSVSANNFPRRLFRHELRGIPHLEKQRCLLLVAVQLSDGC
jgi:hypothetical protein